MEKPVRLFFKILTMLIIIVCLSISQGFAKSGHYSHHATNSPAASVSGKIVIGINPFVVMEFGQPVHYASPRPYCGSGFWVVEKVWVPPVSQRIWVSGHYSHHHRWVSGRWITKIVSPGYYKHQKVWKPYNSHQYHGGHGHRRSHR